MEWGKTLVVRVQSRYFASPLSLCLFTRFALSSPLSVLMSSPLICPGQLFHRFVFAHSAFSPFRSLILCCAELICWSLLSFHHPFILSSSHLISSFIPFISPIFSYFPSHFCAASISTPFRLIHFCFSAPCLVFLSFPLHLPTFSLSLPDFKPNK